MAKYFKESEFACPCCGVNRTQPRLIELLDSVRENLGRPLHINSGYRCVKHNAEVPGSVAGSQHVEGAAADISTANLTPQQKAMLLRFLLPHFSSIGIAKTFFHVDLRPKAALWVY